MTKVIRLYAMTYVKDNLGWYLMNGNIKASAAKSLDNDYQVAVKELLPHVNDIIEAYNLPKIP